jgi:K+ transporter
MLIDRERLTFKDMGDSMFLVRAIYGFKETPDVSETMELIGKEFKIECDMMDTSFSWLERRLYLPLFQEWLCGARNYLLDVSKFRKACRLFSDSN